MRIIISFIFFLTLTHNLYSQDTTHVYFDENWRKTKKIENTKYHRIIYNQHNLWYVEDFYSNGILQMKGIYQDKRCKKRNGEFIYYFENGNIDHKGNYVNNNKEGIWHWFFETGAIASSEIYSKGLRIKAEFWDINGNIIDSAEAECMPKFNGGNPYIEFHKYVEANLQYPELACINFIEGEVVVSFIVEKDGHLTNVKVIKSIDYELDREAVRVVRSSPKWEPGKMHNRYVRSKFDIPIVFILQ